MRDLLLLRCFASHGCCLLALALGMLLTAPAAAQDTPAEQEIERDLQDLQVRLGVYFSASGISDNIDISGLHGGGNIESPEDDVMPYPGSFLSIRYKNYQVTFGRGNDHLSGKEDKHNEHIARFDARYNYYPAEKIFYIFGGPVIWHFHKKFHLQKRTCTNYGPFECEGKILFTDVKTDRPDGKSTTLGINAGFGIEYTLFEFLVFSHEIEFYRSACKYKDFICSGSDFKFLGLHLKF